LGSIFDEDLNRCILLTTDERQAQTKKIIDSIAARYASNGAASLKQLIDRHHALQRMIEPLRVIVPFAPLLAEHFTCERVEARRAFPHVLSLFQASALLHQFQRQRDDHGYVLADPSDYHLTRHLLAGPLARQLGGGLSDPAKRFFDRLAPKVGNGTFSTKDARQHVHGSRASVYGWLSELAEAGVMQMVEAQRGPRPASWQIVGPIEGAVPKLLPATEELFPDFGKTLGH
jgi:hypothetical protein